MRQDFEPGETRRTLDALNRDQLISGNFALDALRADFEAKRTAFNDLWRATYERTQRLIKDQDRLQRLKNQGFTQPEPPTLWPETTPYEFYKTLAFHVVRMRQIMSELFPNTDTQLEHLVEDDFGGLSELAIRLETLQEAIDAKQKQSE